jgi:hypothetical protein
MRLYLGYRRINFEQLIKNNIKKLIATENNISYRLKQIKAEQSPPL